MCISSINLLKVLSNINWGSDKYNNTRYNCTSIMSNSSNPVNDVVFKLCSTAPFAHNQKAISLLIYEDFLLCI